MTPRPVPPPPPPPPPAPPAVNRNVDLEAGQTETKQVSQQEFLKELKELIGNSGGRLLGREEERGDKEDNVILVVAMPLQTVILQNGPMCGIVALAEALELVTSGHSTGGVVCPKIILEEAVRKGYSKQGEMFSVEAMRSLALQFGASQADLWEIEDVSKSVEEKGGFGALGRLFQTLTENLLNGHPVLFPYDADHNHSPSLRKGHAAHWTVVHGLACPVPYHRLSSLLHLEDPVSPSSSSHFQVLQSSRDLVILTPAVSTSTKCTDNNNSDYHQADDIKCIADLLTLENTLVVGHQGKSFHAALWKYTDLVESNRNLKEVAPKITADKDNFVLHEGIEKGLCSKILLLK